MQIPGSLRLCSCFGGSWAKSPGFIDASAKAHHDRSRTSRSAEALLPPHKCGGFHPKAPLPSFSAPCLALDLSMPVLKRSRIGVELRSAEALIRAHKCGGFHPKAPLPSFSAPCLALDLSMPALNRVMTERFPESKDTQECLRPFRSFRIRNCLLYSIIPGKGNHESPFRAPKRSFPA